MAQDRAGLEIIDTPLYRRDWKSQQGGGGGKNAQEIPVGEGGLYQQYDFFQFVYILLATSTLHLDALEIHAHLYLCYYKTAASKG